MEFCSEKELTNQTGHERDDWPLVVLKELADNSLDACEEAGVPPEISVTVDPSGIAVSDNGPGLPAETIEGVLDYTVRASSREAYIAPDRGAQGNALKTILPMPFVLSGGDPGRVDISANGQRHEIVFRVDPIHQEPVVDCSVSPAAKAKNGTTIKVWWPDSASSIIEESKGRFLQIAEDYTFLNPHLSLTVDWLGEVTKTPATTPAWEKWRPSNPTSPHWYAAEHFERLVSAYIAHDQDRGGDRLVREFVREFRGLTGSAKQKKVLDDTGLSRTHLSELANGEGLQHEVTARLLGSMRKHTKPVKPAQLGIIGKDHLAQRFAEHGCEMASFQYKKILDVDDDGLPVVIETAFGWKGEFSADVRRIITGVNWSPGIVNPFRTLGKSYGDGLAALLSEKYAGPNEPIIFLLHCACPRVQYRDRGKSSVVIK
ncbi:MAG: hypothetical protein ACOX1P_16465 [Thermoguttaceae bacterium]